MKGIVFTELLDLVEKKFGLETVEEIINKSQLESNGVYTAVGTYKFTEMISLLTSLSELTKVSKNDLLKIYGLHFFNVLLENYASIIATYKSPLELLASIDEHIHVQVKKLYPDAELPYFETIEKTPKKLIMIYHSSRAMYAFAHGLMEKTFEHFNNNAAINYQLLKKDGTVVKFEIIKEE